MYTTNKSINHLVEKHLIDNDFSLLSVLAALFGLFDDGIYRINLTYDHELGKNKAGPNNKTLIALIDRAYLIDYDPVDRYLYFAECAAPIRPIIMSCSKTRGIYRINLNKLVLEREVSEHSSETG